MVTKKDRSMSTEIRVSAGFQWSRCSTGKLFIVFTIFCTVKVNIEYVGEDIFL